MMAKRRKGGERGAAVLEQPESLTDSPFGDSDSETLLAPRKPNKAARYLALVLILVVGFIGGAQIQKHLGKSSSGSGSGSSSASRARSGSGLPAGMPSGGFGGSAAGGLSAGTIEKVVGDTVYIKTSSGKTIKVKVGSSTQVAVLGSGTGAQPGAAASAAPSSGAGSSGSSGG